MMAASCYGGVLLEKGLVHLIDGIMKEDYQEILKQHLKASVRRLKLGHNWGFSVGQ